MLGGWRTLHNEVLHNLRPSPNIIRNIKSRRMREVDQEARMGRRRTHKPEGGTLIGRTLI
jgi:hypothetical protein